jgi:hypothetical protein
LSEAATASGENDRIGGSASSDRSASIDAPRLQLAHI